MKFHAARTGIETLAYALPPEVWTSESIEARLAPAYERLKLPEGRLELMTGIRERRFWPANKLPSEAAAEAGRAALVKSQLRAEEIDLLIFAGVCRDRLEPATASGVHARLQLPEATAIMDLSNACLGFCNALTVAGALIESGQIQAALIVSGENGRPLMDWTLAEMLRPDQTRKSLKRYFANLTIGAGAVAATVVNRDEHPASLRLRAAVTLSDTTAHALCQGGNTGSGGLEMLTDSEALMQAGVALAARTWESFAATTGWSAASLDRVVCHQVGKQHQRTLLERLGIPLEKDFSTYPELGNIGSVSLPITLAKAQEAGAIPPGSKVAGCGIGSGLSCMMLAFEADA